MASSTGDGDRLRWAQNEEISRWILRVELYAASQGWDDKKTAGKAALNLPSDKLDVLLALPGEDRTSWKKIKAILVREFQPSKENSEELFLNRMKKDGESYLVYAKHLERLYRESFGLTSEVKLNQQSLEAVKRQFLRGIKQEIAQRLKLHNPDDPLDLLVPRAKEIEEILIRPNNVRSVNTSVSVEQLQHEVKELKDMVASLATSTHPSDITSPKVDAITPPRHQLGPDRRQRGSQRLRQTGCFTCGKVGHIARNCPDGPKTTKNVECHNCGGRGHLARQCPSPPLN